jgi:hypothetical protein
MLKTLGTMVAVGLIAIGVSGCGSGSGDDIAARYCNKLQSCNYLSGSVQECQDNSNKYLESLTSAERADYENEANQCLAKQACADFAACMGL